MGLLSGTIPCVNLTDFFTLCCKKWLDRPIHVRRFRAGAWVWAGLWCLAFAWTPQTVLGQVRLDPLEISNTEQIVVVSAKLSFELPVPVDDALHRGVPLFFSAEAGVYLERWYWTDKVLARAQRYWRLSFQPLTRRYRLQSSALPIENSGFGAGLAQSFDALPEALLALQRISNWTLPTGTLDEGAKHRIEFRFRLEPNALLRPWLTGTNEGEWGLSIQRNQAYKPGVMP